MDLWLVTQRKPLEQTEPIWLLRWLLRRYFKWRGFACRSHCDCDGKCYASIEYRGIFINEADARWTANCPGGKYQSIPLDVVLPEETINYGKMDVPMSEASAEYRRGIQMPYAAIPRKFLKRLQQSIDLTQGE